MVFVFAFGLVGLARAKDACNRYPPLLGFQIDKYMGRWWQMEKTPTVSELPGKCWSSFYYRDIQNVNKVKLRMDYVTRLTNAPNTFFSTVAMPNPLNDPSLFMYAVPAMPWMKRQYRVLATDYENFSIEYMCSPNMMGQPEETVWLLTRSRHPSLEVMQQARHTLQVLGLDKVKLYEADQTCQEKAMKNKSMLEWLMAV